MEVKVVIFQRLKEVVVYGFSPHIWEAEAGRLLGVQSQPDLCRKSQGCQRYIVRPKNLKKNSEVKFKLPEVV